MSYKTKNQFIHIRREYSLCKATNVQMGALAACISVRVIRTPDSLVSAKYTQKACVRFQSCAFWPLGMAECIYTSWLRTVPCPYMVLDDVLDPIAFALNI